MARSKSKKRVGINVAFEKLQHTTTHYVVEDENGRMLSWSSTLAGAKKKAKEILSKSKRSTVWIRREKALFRVVKK